MATFIDEAKIYLKAGDGGNGCVAWRREAHVPRGGPAGGDGGNGGSVIFVADASKRSLLDFRYKRHFKAKAGEAGRGKLQNGANGDDILIKVPIGTQLYDVETGAFIDDLDVEGKQVTVCKGGSGGHGNARFKSATRQAPEFAKPGTAGEERDIKLSLKLLADVGLLGFPNAGKSTLVGAITRARPKIADYPFTTLVPQLGIVQTDRGSFCIADIPGLIEGASEGAGLGIRFLKHLERVAYILHLIEPPDLDWEASFDGTDDEKVNSIIGYYRERYDVLRRELTRFSSELAARPELIALSKLDTVSGDENRQTAMQIFTEEMRQKSIPTFMLSSLSQDGLEPLVRHLDEQLNGYQAAEAPYNPADNLGYDK